MGSKLGVLKIAAKRLGIPFDEYMEHIENGEKHCGKCRQWKPVSAFYIDNSRGSGRASICIKCQRVDNPYENHHSRGKSMPEEQKQKISKTLKEYYKTHTRNTKGRPSPLKGRKMSPECKEKVRKAVLKTQKYGKEHPNYIDGRAETNMLLRKNNESRAWREEVFKRDSYTCQHCGDNRGGNLNAHHIKSWTDHIKLRYVVSNGVTLCKKCHTRVHRAV